MDGFLVTYGLPIGEPALCIGALSAIILRKHGSRFHFLCMFLGFRALCDSLMFPLLFIQGNWIEKHLAYRLYFYIYWVGFGVESVLSLLIIYSIFSLAMAPLDGLQRLGAIVFRWAAGISIAVALASVMVPHLTGRKLVVAFVTELQRTESIVTLCLLLFVCFAIRPMGLTYSSRIFGVSFGLGILATTNLIASAWMAHFHRVFTAINTVTGVVTCAVLLLWIGYFALPEPKRRLIVLPTTSPFLRWNQIAQVLGDEPGYVAIGGIPPELLAPAEIEVMRRASLKMTASPSGRIEQPQTA